MQPCTIIIFGATGDLAKKKLLPALYHLNIENRLTDDTRIICMGRQETTQSQWHEKVTEYISLKARNGLDDDSLKHFLSKIDYFKCDLTESSSYQQLNTQLQDPSRNYCILSFY
jgi:glucose-6-phosphate 1-dehydrogenase